MSTDTRNCRPHAKTAHLDPVTCGSVDLSAESEITIHPDGRIHLFGITRPAVELLVSIPTGDQCMRRRLGRMLDAGRGLVEPVSSQQEEVH
jgi:hypothetical protein